MPTPPGTERLGTAYEDDTEAGRLCQAVRIAGWDGFILRDSAENSSDTVSTDDLSLWQPGTAQVADAIIEKIVVREPPSAALELILIGEAPAVREKANEAQITLHGSASLVSGDSNFPLQFPINFEGGQAPLVQAVFRFNSHGSETGGADLEFEDGSYASAHRARLRDHSTDTVVSTSSGEQGARLDTGLLLIEPLTTGEFQGIEGVLDWLRSQAETYRLTERQQEQILAIAEIIRTNQRLAEPGSTPRWKMIGLISGALFHLAEQFPESVLDWIELSEKLEKMGWPGLAEAIEALVSTLP